jgi:hypothetical protein
MRAFKKLLKWFGLSLATILVLVSAVFAYWYHRPNQAEVDPLLGMELWSAVQEEMHDSNTDLLRWQGNFYLVHARSGSHLGTSDARLLVWRSPDARKWTQVAEIAEPEQDLRDPKLAVIQGRLHLYALKNADLEPQPYVTVHATSEDGQRWSKLRELEPRGWLFWQPKSPDGETWYVTAYWHEHGKSMLLRSRDGVQWDKVSDIHDGDRNDETALEFMDDGRMLVTARLEGERAWHQGSPDAATLLAVAGPPYTAWTKTVSKTTRLDGPVLFRHQGRIYAVGRFDPEGYDSWYHHSSLLGRKRTALYEVREDALIRLSDLPSAGDTAYAGVVLADGFLYVSYYSSDIERDYPWYLGLVTDSHVLMARIPLERLVNLADARANKMSAAR